MRRFVVFMLICIVLSVMAFSDKKPKKSRKRQKADTALVVKSEVDSVKVSKADSLQMVADSLLLQLNSGNGLFIPHIDALMTHLIEGDADSMRQATLMQFAQKVIHDLHPFQLKQDSVLRLLVKWIKIQRDIQSVQMVLSISYDAAKLEQADQTLHRLDSACGEMALKTKLEFLKKGVRYYKNKMAIRRVGDIIDELYELKADSTLFADSMQVEDSACTVGAAQIARRDSLYGEIVNHQGRNHLIDYVPYAVSLRKKIVDAFPFDSEKHVLLEQADWDAVEAIRKEIMSIINNK